MADFPTLLCHEGSADTPRPFTDHNRQAPGAGWCEDHRRRQLAHETAAPDYHPFPTPFPESLSPGPFPARLLVTVSQSTSYPAGHCDYAAIDAPEISPPAQTTESHLRSITTNWVTLYNTGRPHSRLGPGIQDPPPDLPAALQIHSYRVPNHLKVIIRPILSGLHHEYGQMPTAA
jgi:hypothetical protein